MGVDVLLGLQWGDEGKGKIVDVLTPNYDVISRFQGGPNAGHTLEFGGHKFVLHTIPSGIFQGGKINIIGNGVVLNPAIFKEEIDKLLAAGHDLEGRLFISRKAHLILPTHTLLDLAYEEAKGKEKIGSTLKGIGPTYTDKVSRNGLRIGDVEGDFKKRYIAAVNRHKKILDSYNFDYSNLPEIEERWFEGLEVINKFEFIDSEYKINEELISGKKVLAEGAQGTLLDIDFGSYPFVTSSNTISAGACTGLGIAPNKIGEIFGIFKAYCTRVGSGPFPTELEDEVGQKLRDQGFEYGSTTGRPRRCGWLDLVALKYSVMINGVTQLIMMKGDVLDSFKTLKIANAYKTSKGVSDHFPNELDDSIEVVYEEFEGWESDLTSITNENDFPIEFKRYIKYIENVLKVPISIVSVGPDRKQTIIRNKC